MVARPISILGHCWSFGALCGRISNFSCKTVEEPNTPKGAMTFRLSDHHGALQSISAYYEQKREIQEQEEQEEADRKEEEAKRLEEMEEENDERLR
jgi:hypothetical protein